MRNKIKRSTVCIILGLFLLQGAYVAPVAEAQGLNVAPTLIELRLTPGEVQQGIYRLKNETEDVMAVTVQPENWMVRLFGAEGELDVSDWFVVTPTEFDLAPGEEKDITYTMTAPFKFTGEKVAQVFFGFKHAQSDAMLSTRLGVIVYMMAKGAEKVDGVITNVNVSYKMPQNKEETRSLYRISFDVDNRGNVHLRPFGHMVVRDARDERIVDSVELAPSKGIYPEKQDNFLFNQQGSILAPGKYMAKVHLDIGQLYGMDKTHDADVTFEVNDEEEKT
jgi:hypothetical protein